MFGVVIKRINENNQQNHIEGLSQNILIPVENGMSVSVRVPHKTNFKERLAEKELLRGLYKLFTVSPETEKKIIFIFNVESKKFIDKQQYLIEAKESFGEGIDISIMAASPQALIYAVYEFLIRQGAIFGLNGETYPLDKRTSLVIPRQNFPWHGTPRFEKRGLNPWPNFLNCIGVFNEEGYRSYLENMLRMRFNILGIHVFAEKNRAESFLSFEYGGIGHSSFTETTVANSWSCYPQKTSTYGMGASQYYDSEVFGSDEIMKARNCWEAAELAQSLWKKFFRYAEKLGIDTGIGFEPYTIPEEIYKATPPEAHFVGGKKLKAYPYSLVDPESIAAKDILENRLARLLEIYPSVKYVWLWEDEYLNWESQKSSNPMPLSVTPFIQAHDFLKRHAPDKKLVLSGWGGVSRHLDYFHKKLPPDIIFACLNDNFGWDPVPDVFGRLEDRERWTIPWLEDDPAMWLPQFHVHRFQRDLNLAEQYGCKGVFGAHWRQRIIDINSGYQSLFSWDKKLTPQTYYKKYCSTLISPERANKLTEILNGIDKNHTILQTATGKIKNGHYEFQEFSGDYYEAFTFWIEHKIPDDIVTSQKSILQRLRKLTKNCSSQREEERLGYLTGYIEFLPPFTESWILAMKLHSILQKALKLKRNGKKEEAEVLIKNSGVPLWISLAHKTREAILSIQRIVYDRNDLGTLASIHNKFERLALTRLRLSMKEFLGELPRSVEETFLEVIRPDFNKAIRIIVPIRPSMLEKRKKLSITAIIPGQLDEINVELCTRPSNSRNWQKNPMRLKGRRTYEGYLGPVSPGYDFLDYYVRANVLGLTEKINLVAPLEAPEQFYRLTVL